MSTAEKDIFDGGLAVLRDIPDRPPTAWPNVKDNSLPPDPEDPNDPGLWWEVRWFPNEHSDPFWANGPVNRRGFFQVLVCCRPDFGAAAIDEAQRLIGLLPKGTAIGPVSVTKEPWLAPPIQEDDRDCVPVTISYSGLAT